MDKLIKINILLFALVFFGLVRAEEGTELVYTRAGFDEAVGKGLAVAFIYTLNPIDQQEIDLPDGGRDHTPQWHAINRVDEMLARLSNEGRYDEVVTFIRVNLARGDLAALRERYALRGPAILLFSRGRVVGKPVHVEPGFNLLTFKQTAAWLKFNDFVQQRLIDLDRAARAKARRAREQRRIYDSYEYYYGPRPYLGFGWGGGYYGPGWGGWGWGGPGYVGFGVTL